MSVQRFDLYQSSAVDIFLELLKRRICYYTKKVQQNDDTGMIPAQATGGGGGGGNGIVSSPGPNEKFSLRLIRSKLRKREESSGIHRTNVVHPEGVLQATVVGTPDVSQDPAKISPLEDIFIAPVSNRTSFTTSPSDHSLSGYSSETQLPMFLYSTGNSRNSLHSSNDQDILVHPSGPADDLEYNNNNNYNYNNNNNNNINNNNNHHHHHHHHHIKDEVTKKNIKGKLRKLVRRKSPPAENYALPLELREQLKQIYVY